ncbi:Rho GTPase [Pelomyxa schiedti]|nr:Rho GTPase [Pelomyxa schiedti]
MSTSTSTTTSAAAATTTASSSTSSSSGGTTATPPVVTGCPKVRKRTPGQVTKVVKIGVVGDGTVGKTTLLLGYITQGFITEYTPTVYDNFSAIEEIGSDVINVILWDTAGQDDYQGIRQTCYTFCNYDLFFLCFSVVHRDSFDNVRFKWLTELKRTRPNTPLVLVGTKTDLREEGNKAHVTFKEGEKRARDIRAKMYLECTSKNSESINAMMASALGIIMERDEERKRKIEKQYKKEKKEEEKLAKKLAKLEAAGRERSGSSAASASTTTTTSSTTTSPSTTPSTTSPSGSS